jgi:hypothetical protein
MHRDERTGFVGATICAGRAGRHRAAYREIAMARFRRTLSQGLLVAFVITAAAPCDASPALKGRYKKEGGSCVWDATDSGPNQCEPWTKGRFKKDGDRCVWASSDSGPDQCTPRGGRFKKEGDRCVWTANDSGPNQCNPREPR